MGWFSLSISHPSIFEASLFLVFISLIKSNIFSSPEREETLFRLPMTAWYWRAWKLSNASNSEKSALETDFWATSSKASALNIMKSNFFNTKQFLTNNWNEFLDSNCVSSSICIPTLLKRDLLFLWHSRSLLIAYLLHANTWCSLPLCPPDSSLLPAYIL